MLSEPAVEPAWKRSRVANFTIGLGGNVGLFGWERSSRFRCDDVEDAEGLRISVYILPSEECPTDRCNPTSHPISIQLVQTGHSIKRPRHPRDIGGTLVNQNAVG